MLQSFSFATPLLFHIDACATLRHVIAFSIKHGEKLLNVEDEALELLALGVVDVYGMIGGLCELVQDAHLAAALSGCTEDS